ncbi:MAG: OmpW/AlkL family protein [Steroidobacteraceae bacterium]
MRHPNLAQCAIAPSRHHSAAATLLLLSAAALLAGSPRAARADDASAAGSAAHPNELRIGLYYVHSAANADDLSGPYVPPGLNLRIEDMETLYVAYVRRLSAHFNVELAAGWPPLAKTVGRGPAYLGSVPYNGQEISSARWFGPTLLLNYEFFDETHRFRPYIGFGVNYTKFYSRQSTAAGDAAAGGPTSISLPASVGPAGDVGLSYRVTDRLGVYVSYSASFVRSRLTADTAGVIRTSDINFGPRALVVSAGWSF